MKQQVLCILISLLFISTSIFLSIPQTFQAISTTSSSSQLQFTYLSEDTITYFQVPQNAELIILYDHVWAYGNSTFTIYDETGAYYDSCTFRYDEDLTTKTIYFSKEGTYKLVATGVNFRYQLTFSGPEYEYKCVAAAMPHKSVFRVKNDEIATAFIPVFSQNATFFFTTDYVTPARDATIRIYDEHDQLKDTINMDSTDFLTTYEKNTSIQRSTSEEVFYRIEIEGHGGGQSRVVVWTNYSQYDLATGHCTFLTPDPNNFFIPSFKNRFVSINFEESNQSACIGSSGYVVNDTEFSSLYHKYVNNLDLRSSKHWVSWRWRERQGTTAMNDDADPFHINWDGFDMQAFDERMSYYHSHHIEPILCFQWDSTAFISTHPAYWSQNEIDEFAEYCLAVAIHCVAPDLKQPPECRDPYQILGIMPFNEPNLIYTQELDLETSVDAYLKVLKTVGNRFKNHSDPRINQLSFAVPGSTMSLYGSDELYYWISEIIQNASQYADIITWDQYSYYLLEELPEYQHDVIKVKTILENNGLSRPLALSEFGIHGGVPTIQEFYGSRFAQLYVFGATAQNMNAGMTYPVYFTLIDPSTEARQKGLITGVRSFPPFSMLPPVQPKPQYYAVQIIGWICQGTILDVTNHISQLDIMGSIEENTYRIGISNRYDAETMISLPVHEDKTVQIYRLTDTGLSHVKQKKSTGIITLTIPPWTIYYLETDSTPIQPKSDLSVEGTLSWNNVKPGENLTGSINLRNSGDEGTILDWEIRDYPSWGQWHFNPQNGTNVSPEQGPIEINITVTAPLKKNKEFNEYIIIQNTQDPSDFDTVPVALSTPYNHVYNVLTFLKQFIPSEIIDFLSLIYEHRIYI